MSDDLPRLRDAIADVDRALLELLRRRMELAAEVGQIKTAAGLPIVVRDVEDQVLRRARHQAETCGISEEVLEAVFQAILRGSVERQHRVGVALRGQRGGRLLILGGAGGMGGWFRGFFEVAGHHVDLVDPAFADLPAAPGRHARLADLPDLDAYAAVLVSVPLDRTPEVLAEVIELAPRGLVVEIASIKSHLEEALGAARERGVRTLALHPMFGPGKSFYEPLTFVLAAQGEPAAEQAALEPLLTHPYTRLVTVPFAHHDRLMGWLLGLAHLNGMLFGTAIARSGISAEELRACASTTFTRQASTALSILAEDPGLYLDIQRLNPHRGEVYRAARESLGRLEELVESGDREAFRQLLNAARDALAH
jgi:chorismate mutase / prephenate dehydrogenase